MEAKCVICGATGHGVQFNIFGPYEFGTVCVPCEKEAKEKGYIKITRRLNCNNSLKSGPDPFHWVKGKPSVK